MNTKTPVAIIGVPLDLGAGRRGVDMGPSAIRVAGLHRKLELMGVPYEDWDDVDVANPGERTDINPRMKYLPEITKTCEIIRDLTEKAVNEGRIPVVLGGDHSLAMGSYAGVAKAFRRKKKKVGIIWIDAHTDMNTPDSSPSGNIHGMPLSHILGQGADPLRGLAGFHPMVDAKNVALIGIRSVDKRERDIVRESGVTVFTMRDIDEQGLFNVIQKAIGVATQGTAGFHFSFDLDGCAPDIAPGVGTPVPGGLTLRESYLICETVADSGKLTSMDMVELNSTMDERNRTAQLALKLIASALGDSIL